MRCGSRSGGLLLLACLVLLPGFLSADEVFYQISETELTLLEETLTKQETELKRLGTALTTAETQLEEAETATNNLSLLHARLGTSLRRLENAARWWKIGTIASTSAAGVGWLLFLLFK